MTSLELSQVKCLLTDLHPFVEPSFLRQVSNLVNILGLELSTVEEHLSLVRHGDLIDDPNKRGLTGAIGSEQAEDAPFWNGDRNFIKCLETTEVLYDFIGDKNLFHLEF